MKKVIVSAMAVFAFTFANAQEKSNPTLSEGSWVVEVNTGFGAAHESSTGFYLWNEDGDTAWGLGGEAGYFIMENLALKAGIGFRNNGAEDNNTAFSYKVGAKYYINGQFPVQMDLSGATGSQYKAYDNERPFYIGLQGGYAYFITDRFAIEPGLRYNISLNSDYYDDVLQLNVGLALFF